MRVRYLGLEEPMSIDSGSQGWWDDLERDVLDCLTGHQAVAPRDIGMKLGISEAGIVSLVGQLAVAGKLDIVLVQAARSAN